MATTLPTLAIPGQRLGPITTFTAGPGTHVQNANIYASIAGPVAVEQGKASSNSTPKAKSVLTVSRGLAGVMNFANNPAGAVKPVQGPQKKGKYNTLPSVDSIVLARVTRVQKRQATVSILVVLDPSTQSDPSTTSTQTPGPNGNTSSDNDNIASILTTAANPENHSSTDELRFQALIRKEDVRAVEKDRVVMDDMFRVGDIVRGSVISLGDQSFYYLTTARNDLGVVLARSEAGNMMFPASWKEMRDSVTGVPEPRKVARPF
ncbi:Exosome complex subunit Csl4 [Aspergillus sclerotialis]|uniref:Exosome complex subunit Csl4 n=1 Tax=Aspergillus sclerotialis TaxID=2070753 RepID=A0A3A2ZC52_9EURO|nr:Exosome complex subunit Csl4 [Aspergillus sclerotialis]